MTNEELKKKIISALQSVEFVTEKGWCGQCISLRLDYSAIADALIAAGIGDVKETEAEANRYEMLYKMQSRDMVLAERKVHEAERKVHEAEHRAARAERAIDLILTREKDLRCIHSFTNCDKNCELCWEGYFSKQKQGYLEQAEKELAEERKE